MTSANPPYPYFNGITYNSQYFTSLDVSITQAQANALYLKKTTTDTATALETFNAGIATTEVNSSTGAILFLGNGTSTTSVNIGNGAANVICNSNNIFYTGNLIIDANVSGSGNLTLGNTRSAGVLIGKVGGYNEFNGTTTFNNGLALYRGQNITLQPAASYVAPTAGTMLGGISVFTAVTGLPFTIGNNAIVNYSLVTNGLPVGVYTASAIIQITPTANTQRVSINFNNGNISTGMTISGAPIISFCSLYTTDSWYTTTQLFITVTNGTTSTFTIQPFSQNAASSLISFTLYLMRIA